MITNSIMIRLAFKSTTKSIAEIDTLLNKITRNFNIDDDEYNIKLTCVRKATMAEKLSDMFNNGIKREDIGNEKYIETQFKNNVTRLKVCITFLAIDPFADEIDNLSGKHSIFVLGKDGEIKSATTTICGSEYVYVRQLTNTWLKSEFGKAFND